MTPTQPQLFSMSLVKDDVVFTFDHIARDVVSYFKPSGRILEPCCGDGVFLRYLPADTEWCEIERGRDFFAWHKRVDWIVGNPPYSVFTQWLQHSFELSDNIVYIVPTNKNFNSYKLFETIYKWGGIHTIYHLGAGRNVCDYQELGFAFSATYYKRNYKGGINVVISAPATSDSADDTARKGES